MYVIVTSNVKLIVYVKKYHGDVLTTPQKINLKRYREEAVALTTNKNIAILALVEGAKVYETATLCSIIPLYHSKKELIDVVIDEFFEAIGIRKTHEGYEYIKYMLKCNVKDEEYCLKAMTKEVYPECAKLFGVRETTVARQASDVIKKSYFRNADAYDVLFERTHHSNLKEPPKVNQFVVLMADKIRNVIMEEKT